MHSSSSRADLLRRIISKAQSIQSIVGTRISCLPQPSSSSRISDPLPPIQLPFPDDIVVSISYLELPNHTSDELICNVTQKILGSQRFFLQSYEKACRDLTGSTLAPQNLERIRSTYQTVYHEQYLKRIRADIARFHDLLKDRRKELARKPAFNSQYTPLLEKYFEQNAYPSISDRLVLAQKSNMTARQIEVWFQNHRNREKNKRSLKRLSRGTTIPISILLELDSDTPFEGNWHPSERDPSPQTNDLDGEIMSSARSTPPSINSFTELAPAHAFPTPFSFSYAYNPFPTENGAFKFDPPVWRRSPATPQIPSPPPVDMDQLIDQFSSRLTIRDSSKKQGKSDRSTSNEPWFASQFSVTSAAPHPALINKLSASQPQLRARQSSLPPISFASTSLLPAQFSAQPRKAPPFQRRTPANLFFFNADSTSSMSPLSSRTSSSSQSRVSSFSSASSIEPTTPPMSPSIQPMPAIFSDQDCLFFAQLLGVGSEYLFDSPQKHPLPFVNTSPMVAI